MLNNSPQKCPMPTQSAQQRSKNFTEVSLGYTKEMAVQEAQRCLQCKHKPCVEGCPVKIDIPAFVGQLAQANFAGAYCALAAQTSLPGVCGRVCPQESQCEAKCVRAKKGQAVAIGRLERFAADWQMCQPPKVQQRPAANGHRVAVVGAGPAGLTAAGQLAKLGYGVTVFEALHKPGGVLVYGIPEFRLPKQVVHKEIQALKELGVEIVTNALVGRLWDVDELFEDGFKAVFIASGAGLPKFMGIPGENLNAVFSANEFLTRINLMQAWQEGSQTPVLRARRVAVVGGGNVAMDAARCAKRLGADQVSIVYRRSMQQLPARAEEVEHAQEEGIIFKTLAAPKQVLGDENGRVTGLQCLQCSLGPKDESGRSSPVEIPGSEFVLEIDALIMAIGTTPNPLICTSTKGLQQKPWGGIVTINQAGETTRKAVWAGGDVVTGAATVILAMGAGKCAAAGIDDWIMGRGNQQ